MQCKLYTKFAQFFARYQSDSIVNSEAGRDGIEAMCKEFMPSGSGFNAGTQFDFDSSTENKLVFDTGFHHMNDAGMYDGWTSHSVIVTPSFIGGIDVKVTGRNRNGIKEYIAESFHAALMHDASHEITHDGTVIRCGGFSVTI